MAEVVLCSIMLLLEKVSWSALVSMSVEKVASICVSGSVKRVSMSSTASPAMTASVGFSELVKAPSAVPDNFLREVTDLTSEVGLHDTCNPLA